MTNLLDKTISSMDVAEMVEKEHKDVLRDIRNIIRQLGESKIAQSYFIKSYYINSQNKELPCFSLTKKGCELYGTRMTGEKGTLFAVEYIERFNEMEESVKELSLPTDPMEILALTFEAQKQEKEKLKLVDSRVTDLEENVSIAPGDYSYLTRRINKTVYRHLAFRGYHKTKEQVSLFYEDINQGIHKISGVKTRSRLKQKHFNSVDSFISEWSPSAATINLSEAIEKEINLGKVSGEA